MKRTKVVVIGGGTFNHISCHLSLAAPAFGATARTLAGMYKDYGCDVDLILTKMADPINSKIVTNGDLLDKMVDLVQDMDIKVLVMNAAVCDFEMENPSDETRLSSSKDYTGQLKGLKGKLVQWFKNHRPDVVVVAFKTTHSAAWTTQLSKAALSLESNGVDVVLANDVGNRNNIVLVNDGTLVQADRPEALKAVVTSSLDLLE